MPQTPFDVVTWDTIQPVFLTVIALLILGLIPLVLRYRKNPTRKNTAAAVVVAAALVAAGGLYAFDASYVYVTNNYWWFNYSLSVQGNGTAPEAVIVPAPKDGSLLAKLSLESGQANWSLVDTPHGRGLFVQFEGSALLETYVSEFPPPLDPLSGEPTMSASTNCTAAGSGNCTGFPQLWMYYSGSSGAEVIFTIAEYGVRSYPTQGWATYETRIYLP